MKSIEFKLKQDAENFKIQRDIKLYENIMANINYYQHTDDNNKKSFNFYQWLIPTGFAVATLFFLALNIRQSTSVNEKINFKITSQELLAMGEIKFDSFPQVLESKLIDPIKAEKQALQQDLLYLKGIFIRYL